MQPVLDELVAKLDGTNSGIVLADHRSVILDSRATTRAVSTEMDRLAIMAGHAFGEGSVGTNGVGTAAEERKLVRVAGAEHYLEIFKHLTCLGVPLVHPLNRRLMGVLDLTIPKEEEHPLMRSLMEDAGRRIERLLTEWASLRERAQFECFLTLGRRSSRPVLSVMDDVVLLNRSARELHPIDQAVLLRALGDIGAGDHRAVLSLDVEDEPVSVRVHTQTDQARFQGVVIEVLPSTRRSAGRPVKASLPGLVGRSAAWTDFCAQAAVAAAAGVAVLVRGEPGTGKLASAQALHALTGRSELTVADVATALAERPDAWLRRLRRALGSSQSTVVLRHLELCDAVMSAAIAAEIDGITGSGALLFATLTTGPCGTGLPALLDRFSVQVIVPPLRDRRDDIGLLVHALTTRHVAARTLRFHPETLALLRSTDFAGNVRELGSLIKGVAARRSGDVLPADLPVLTADGPLHLTTMERAERAAIVEALPLANGNKASTAAALGISRPTLYRKIGLYEIPTCSPCAPSPRNDARARSRACSSGRSARAPSCSPRPPA